MIKSIERRKRKPVIPSDLRLYLNTDQMNTYIRLQEIGWRMHFIRSQLSRKPTIVMKNSVDRRIGVIEQGGGFTVNPTMMTTRRTLSELLPVNDDECP